MSLNIFNETTHLIQYVQIFIHMYILAMSFNVIGTQCYASMLVLWLRSSTSGCRGTLYSSTWLQNSEVFKKNKKKPSISSTDRLYRLLWSASFSNQQFFIRLLPVLACTYLFHPLLTLSFHIVSSASVFPLKFFVVHSIKWAQSETMQPGSTMMET